MQDKGLKRDIIDKYYTKETVVDECIEIIKKVISINRYDLIIEPSAGNGAFIKSIISLSDNYKFYDIVPEHKDIIRMDYLTINFTRNNIHVIGNPPFGRQSSLAKKFIKKSCEFANSISFILPKSFKKPSMINCFPLNYHLIHCSDISDNSFLVNSIECDVPCVFQIWQYKESKRDIEDKLIPNGFKFVKKNENPDISFRRVGVNAGMVSKDVMDKSLQSHYFIKFTKKFDINKLNNIVYDFNNTVGPKSISKPELIKTFNKNF